MPHDFAAIRELVDAAFGDEDLSAFCCDHCPRVYEQFTAGQTKGARVRMLVDYARRHGLVDQLLAEVERANPHKYAEFAPRLKTAVPVPRPRIGCLVAAVGMVLLVGIGVGLVALGIKGRDGTPSPRLTEPAVAKPTPTPTPMPIYQSGLITYISQDEGERRLYALQPDGTPATLVEGAVDAVILAVSPHRDYLAIAQSDEVELTRSSDYLRFIGGEGLSLVVVSADGQESTTVVEGVPLVSATYTPGGELVVAVLADSTITYTVTRVDGSGARELHRSHNVFVTPEAVEEAVEEP
jgi:hypothetical protein